MLARALNNSTNVFKLVYYVGFDEVKLRIFPDFTWVSEFYLSFKTCFCSLSKIILHLNILVIRLILLLSKRLGVAIRRKDQRIQDQSQIYQLSLLLLTCSIDIKFTVKFM